MLESGFNVLNPKGLKSGESCDWNILGQSASIITNLILFTKILLSDNFNPQVEIVNEKKNIAFCSHQKYNSRLLSYVSVKKHFDSNNNSIYTTFSTLEFFRKTHRPHNIW